MRKDKKLRSWHMFRDRNRHQHWRAALVGMGAGGIAIVFQHLLEVTEQHRLGLVAHLHQICPTWGWLVLPAIAGVVGAGVGLMTSKIAPEIAGSGIPHVKGVLMHVSSLSWLRVLPTKFVGGLLCIGSGFSMGREGPTIQMGAAVGRLVADIFHAPAKAAPRLMACGAGAGLAAAFHAPLAGFIFAIEELQREFSDLTYAMALIAAVVADIVTTAHLGSENVFHSSGFPAAPLESFPVYAAVGLVAGVFGTAFNLGLLRLQEAWQKRKMWPTWARGTAAGVLVGLVAWWLPAATGGGHQIAESILHGSFVVNSVGFLVALFVGKFLLTVICYASGVPGGIFAPMLVMGAALGTLIGIGGSALLPTLAPVPQSFAAIGMAAFFSAAVRAPLTGIVLVLEMTGDYNQLLPLLVASMIAYVVSGRLKVEPIYDALLELDLHGKHPDVPAHREPILLEFVVQEESAMDGQSIKDVPLPERSLLVTVTRHGNDILPDGNTVLNGGDHITAVVSGADTAGSITRLLSLSKV